MGEIGAGTEGGWGAGDDDRPYGLVRLEGLEGADDLVHHLHREGVTAPGIVEGQGGDAALDDGCNHSVVLTTAGECRKKVSTSRSYLYAGRLSPTVFRRRKARAKLSTAPADV